MTQLTGQTDRKHWTGTDVLPADVDDTSSAPRGNKRHARTTRLLSLADLGQLTKSRITLMVLVTTYVGFTTASGGGGLLLAMTLLATALACMGASVLNQVMERQSDALMHRTRERPLPAGRILPPSALLLGLSLALTGVLVALIGANVLTAALLVFTVVSYTLVYTPLKRQTSLATIVGAVPGALPPVIGATAASGTIGREAAVLFAIMFLWQLPHFLAIAWLYREDFARAGYPMLPVLDPSGSSTFRQILLGCLALLPLGLLPTLMGISGRTYFLGALAAGIVFLGFGVALVIGRTTRYARAMFFASLVYLPTVLVLMMVDRV